MRTMVLLLAVLGGCDKPKEEPKQVPPTPTPTPDPKPVPPPADAATAPVAQTACDALLIFLETGGTWIGAPPNVSCFGENKGSGTRDTAWLKATLQTIQSKLGTCKPALEVAAANGVPYQDIINALDLGVSVGLLNAGVSNPIDLSMKFTASKQPKCDGALTTTSSGSASMPPARLSTSKDDLKTAPVVIITKTEIKLGEEVIGTVDAAMKDSNKNTIPELQRAIPAGSKMVILQADQNTDAKVINRVIKSTKAAGVDNLLFAVKNK